MRNRSVFFKRHFKLTVVLLKDPLWLPTLRHTVSITVIRCVENFCLAVSKRVRAREKEWKGVACSSRSSQCLKYGERSRNCENETEPMLLSALNHYTQAAVAIAVAAAAAPAVCPLASTAWRKSTVCVFVTWSEINNIFSYDLVLQTNFYNTINIEKFMRVWVNQDQPCRMCVNWEGSKPGPMLNG